MPTKPALTTVAAAVTSWSFSRYGDYVKCPYAFKLKHIEKRKEPPNSAMERGARIHKLAEDFTLGKIKKLPAELANFSEEFAALKKQKVKFIEESWAFRKDWSLTAWNDWNECWLRVKLDAAYINTEHAALVIIDHKTGKLSPAKNAEYEMQLELYGLAGLEQQPEVEVVSPRLWYLDEGVIYPDPEEREIEYSRDDQAGLRKKWMARVEPMFNDKTFKPKPGDHCRWCAFSAAKGGPCKF